MRQFFALFFIVSSVALGQKIQYFPQEEIILAECEESVNKSNCLYNSIEKKVLELLEENQKELKKIDTLKTGGRLIIKPNGSINEEKSYFSIRSKNVSKKLKNAFENILDEIKIERVINRKPDNIISSHLLSFNYLIDHENGNITLNHIKNPNEYTGGVIEEVPRYPGCENLSEIEARKCFQEKIQEHIKYHFRYPQEAITQKISGRVSIIFIISKTGKIENIRTRGPHPILEKEAVRIVKFLPDMVPGKHNGQPVKVPFSIPITFKL